MSINTVDPKKVIDNLADELKTFIKQPEWAPYVKTGNHKERPPADKEWFFTRTASILRTIGKQGPIGVAKLRRKYGGRKNSGYKPEHFKKGSGSIIRKAMQQLDKAGITVQAERGVHKGRILTPKGVAMLARAGFVQNEKVKHDKASGN
jgi:small subunit ribosomal protein S19e